MQTATLTELEEILLQRWMFLTDSSEALGTNALFLHLMHANFLAHFHVL